MGIFDSPVNRGIGYGLPGGVARDPSQMGGILGGVQQQPEWANKLGLFSAALNDAAASFSGRESPGSLQAWQQNHQQTQIRQQLMGALSSPDPAIRQQGYQAAAMLGIPTDAFQKQQASQQLPQLLQSMKPTAETATLTAPAFSVKLPSINGMNNDISMPEMSANYDTGKTIPGMSLSDAIGAAPPELQSMYAPKLLDEALKGPDLTPHEGINPKTGKPGQYIMSRDGAPQWLDVGVQLKAPQTRTLQRGLNSVEQQFNPVKGVYEDILGATGPKFAPERAPKPTATSGFSSPASLFRRGTR